ncbi:MAG: hypothetical protein CMI16_11290 [Opitutaceae bacterium]|nr:hypothetical protein [Opitutaceae bacterium]
MIGLSRHSEILESTAVYDALYGKGGLWVRSALNALRRCRRIRGYRSRSRPQGSH